ncbi:MAG: hypothetical protein M1308_22070, partial [Actinobacteria bacterium]|nr:hypothetical protein [Actinomycetota bacterium]
EHIVLNPRRNKSLASDLVKIPRLFNRMSFWPYEPVPRLQLELMLAEALVAGTRVKIPHTTIRREKFSFPECFFPGYIMKQEVIQDDGSVTNIRELLIEDNLMTLVDEYDHEPRNFASKDGFAYWLDPTTGPVGRILENIGVMNIEKWRKIRLLLHEPIRFIGC